MSNPLEQIQLAVQKDKLLRERIFSDELDSNLTIRCNKEFKEAFNSLCKKNQTKSTTAIKQFMLNCIRSGRV
jgi:hypothetical protein